MSKKLPNMTLGVEHHFTGTGQQTLQITVRLHRYETLPPMAAWINELTQARLRALREDPLALVDYWGVDVGYDGTVFRPTWLARRSSSGKGGASALRTVAVLRTPAVRGMLRLYVSAMDVFGLQAHKKMYLRAAAHAPLERRAQASSM